MISKTVVIIQMKTQTDVLCWKVCNVSEEPFLGLRSIDISRIYAMYSGGEKGRDVSQRADFGQQPATFGQFFNVSVFSLYKEL